MRVFGPLMAVLLMVGLFCTAGCATVKGGSGSKRADGSFRNPSEILLVGDEAPDFTAMDQSGNTVKFADYKGKKNVVLVFYPGDDSPQCTTQLCQVRDDAKQYEQADAVVFGVNPADKSKHFRFANKNNFQFPLLVDEGGTIARHYGCRGVAGIVNRTVYVIDKEGKIVFAERGSPGTARQLDALRKK